jgi:hypothetical protein
MEHSYEILRAVIALHSERESARISASDPPHSILESVDQVLAAWNEINNQLAGGGKIQESPKIPEEKQEITRHFA